MHSLARSVGRWILTAGFLGFLTVASFLVGRYVIGPPIKRTLSPVRRPPEITRFSPPETSAPVRIRELPGLPEEPVVRITPTTPAHKSRKEKETPKEEHALEGEKAEEASPAHEEGAEEEAQVAAPAPPSPRPSESEKEVSEGEEQPSALSASALKKERKPPKPSPKLKSPPEEGPSPSSKPPKTEEKPPSPRKPEAERPPEPERRVRPYRVQVGAFQNLENARKVATELSSKGYYPRVVKEGGLYRVQVGAFDEREEASRLADELKEQGYSAIVTP